MKFERAEDLAAKTEGPSSNDITIATNPHGKITKWNKKAEKIFGYSAKEALNQNISMLFSAKNQEKENEYLQEVGAGKAKQYEIACKAKSGKKLSVAFSAFPEYENSGEVTSICQIAYDITNKEQVEERDSVLALVVESSDDAIISKNVKGIITGWNPAATKIFGYSEKEAIGKPITLIFPKDGIDEEDLIIENIRQGQKIENFETIRCAKDKRSKILKPSGVPKMERKNLFY